MSITVQDVSVIQKRIVFKGGYLEYSRNENGQRVRDENGNVIFSNIQEDKVGSDFTEVAAALNTLAKVISSNNKRTTTGRTSPLKGRKLGPRKSKEALATPVQ